MSSMAKWLGYPTGILEGDGFNSRCGIQKFSFWVIRLETIHVFDSRWGTQKFIFGVVLKTPDLKLQGVEHGAIIDYER